MKIITRSVVVAVFSIQFMLVCFDAIAASECKWNKKIWYSEEGSGRWILYFDDKGNSGHWNVFIELWRMKKLAARMHGNYVCSNGASVCTISIAKEYKPYTANKSYENSEGYKNGDLLGTVVVEIVDVTDKNRDQILVTAAFRQSFWNAGDEHVKKFQKFNENFSYMPPRNYFRFYGCRKSPL